jgi:hypothetical protein
MAARNQKRVAERQKPASNLVIRKRYESLSRHRLRLSRILIAGIMNSAAYPLVMMAP